jgi:hypothetical protein
MENPASRLASADGYRSPTIAEMLGLSNPVPSTMNTRPAKNAGFEKIEDNAIAKCPKVISTAP